MSEAKPFYANEGSQYGEGIVLDDYNGTISLVAARKKEDNIYMEWCYPQARDGSRKPIEKSLPWKVSLGDRESAIKALRFFLKELGATDPGGPAPDDPNDKIPF